MANNRKLGGAVIFGTSGITQNVVSGSLLDFSFENQHQYKTATDGNGNFLAVNRTEDMQICNITVLVSTSGSAFAMPKGLDSFSITNPFCDGSGSWNVSGNPKVDFKKEDYAQISAQGSRWLDGSGNQLT